MHPNWDADRLRSNYVRLHNPKLRPFLVRCKVFAHCNNINNSINSVANAETPGRINRRRDLLEFRINVQDRNDTKWDVVSDIQRAVGAAPDRVHQDGPAHAGSEPHRARQCLHHGLDTAACNLMWVAVIIFISLLLANKRDPCRYAQRYSYLLIKFL